jgi:hypothetical protein
MASSGQPRTARLVYTNTLGGVQLYPTNNCPIRWVVQCNDMALPWKAQQRLCQSG